MNIARFIHGRNGDGTEWSRQCVRHGGGKFAGAKRALLTSTRRLAHAAHREAAAAVVRRFGQAATAQGDDGTPAGHRVNPHQSERFVPAIRNRHARTHERKTGLSA